MTDHAQEQNTVGDRGQRKLERDMGTELLAALNDPKTRNHAQRGWGSGERLGEPMHCIGTLRVAQAQAIIKLITRATTAGSHSLQADPGRRVPLMAAASPASFTRSAGPDFRHPIRKGRCHLHARSVRRKRNRMTARQRDVLVAAVRAHRNILVIGGTGSGKTTLVNAIINEMVVQDPTERVSSSGHRRDPVRRRELRPVPTSSDVNMTALLKTHYACAPTGSWSARCVVPKALDLLMAWNTRSRGGAATLRQQRQNRPGPARHAHQHAPRLPKPIEPLIGEAVHMVVHIARVEGLRLIQEILEVSDSSTASTSPKPFDQGSTMQATIAAFHPDRNALFYLGLIAVWRSSCWERSRRLPPKALAVRCRMRAG